MKAREELTAKAKEDVLQKQRKAEEEIQKLKEKAESLQENVTLLNKENQLIVEAKEQLEQQRSEDCK